MIFLFLIIALSSSAAAADMMFHADPKHTGIFNEGGTVPAVNTEVWRFGTGKWGESSPAVANGVVYVGSYDNNLYAIGQKPLIPSTPLPLPTTKSADLIHSCL